MKQRKVKLGLLSPLFYANMKQQVEQMAVQGWMIRRVNSVYAVYELQKPKKLRCHIKHFEPLLLMEPYSKKERDELIEKYAANGWTLIASTVVHQLYVSEDYDAKLEWVDPSLIMRSVKRSRLKHWLTTVFALVAAVWLFVFAPQSFNVMSVLTSIDVQAFVLLVGSFVMNAIVNLFIYQIWIARNQENFAQGITEETIFSNQTALLLHAFNGIVGIMSVILLVFLFFANPQTRIADFVVRVALPLGIGQFFGRAFKRAKYQEEMYFAVFAFLLFLVLILPTDAMSKFIQSYIPPVAIVEADVITLRDLSFSQDDVLLMNDPDTSLFTTKQVDYTEYSKTDFISTRYYVFRSSVYLDWYRNAFDDVYAMRPFPESIQEHYGIQGGYMDDEKTVIVFVKGKSFYNLRSSQPFDQNNLDIVMNKLLHSKRKG